MLALDVCIHARPASAQPGPIVTLAGHPVETLIVPPADAMVGWRRTFDQAAAALQQLPRLWYEPDGSFAWTSAPVEPAWRVEGNLFDAGPRLAYVTLAGRCPIGRFDQFLSTLGWPEQALIFQLPRAAVFLDEIELRRLAQEGG